MRTSLTVLCLVTLSATGCTKSESTPALPASAAPATEANTHAAAAIAPPSAAAAAPIVAQAAGEKSAGKFGAALSAQPAIAVAQVLASPLQYNDKEVKLSGTVSAACQKKGCWMTLGSGEPGATTVRVSFKDYGFFVPTDSMGKRATVEGHFSVKTMSVAEAQHYADDAAKAGTPAKKVTEPEKTFALVATGVELL